MKRFAAGTFVPAVFIAFAGCASVDGSGGWRLAECNDISMPPGAKCASGIAWSGEYGAYVVTDERPARLIRLELGFDGRGVVNSAEAKPLGMPEAASDSEAVAVDPLDGGIWIANEVSGRILKYGRGDPALAISREVPMPAVMKKMRKGRGLESLAISADGLALFTCNEEALVCDGGAATREKGTYVRILKFVRGGVDEMWRPAGQWAYLTEPISGGPYKVNKGDASRNGVSELCLAKDGALLLLERDFSKKLLPNFDCRVYEVDLSDATDVTSLGSLAGDAAFRPARKREVLRVSGFAMYEGLCRGPDLKDGSETFFLCSDGGRGTPAKILHVRRVQ